MLNNKAQTDINNINGNNNEKPQLIPWEEQSDYATMNENETLQNQQMTAKCCKTNKYLSKLKCCNRWMCGCICLIMLFVILICTIIIIFCIAPLFKGMQPEVQSIYIQMFDFKLHEKPYYDIPKVFANGSGVFAIEIYNANSFGFYMHDWYIQTSAMNLYKNSETWGDVHCCANHPKWNKTFPYDNYAFKFDQEFWIPGKKASNMSLILHVINADEELFYAGWEMSWLNDWKLNVGLNGNGFGKTKFLGIDIQLMVDCSIDVNASYFFPFHPPNRNRSISRVPPKKYVWQQFPVVDLNCTFGYSSFKIG